MGGGESKTESSADQTKNQNPFSQNDSLLDLLIQATKQKEDEYKESLDKLNKKLDHVLLQQQEKNGPNASALLTLKYEKLKLKLKKQKERYEEESKLVSTIHNTYSEQKEKLRVLENEKIIQVANLNFEIADLAVKIDDLKQKVKDQDVTYNSKLQAKEFELSVQKNTVTELKRKEQALSSSQSNYADLRAEVANYKQEISSFKLRQVELIRTHQEKCNNLSRLNQNTIVDHRNANVKWDREQSKYKQEIMFLKTQTTDLTRQKADGDAKYNLEVQKNRIFVDEINALNILLSENVKLTTFQQKGMFVQIKSALQGMKDDLQFLFPDLNDATVPTSFECGKELENINCLLRKHQDNLYRVIAYQGRFDSFVNIKRSLAEMEKTPNFLAGVELPCSFLHTKFLPLFRIAFSHRMPQNNNSPRPLLDQPSGTNQRYFPSNDHRGRGRGAYNKTREFSPRNLNEADSTRVHIQRGRGGQTKTRGRPKNKKNANANHSKSVISAANTSDDSDADSTAGVTLTVLTSGTASGVARKVSSSVEMTVEKTECIICCEPLGPRFHTLEDCMHKYHSSCIKEWFESNTECPQCARED